MSFPGEGPYSLNVAVGRCACPGECWPEHTIGKEHWKCGVGIRHKDRDINKESQKNVSDPVNHPAHYTHGKFQPIDVIEDWKLGFCLANCVKYISRAEHKGSPLEDLKKARWYLDREITRREKEQECPK